MSLKEIVGEKKKAVLIRGSEITVYPIKVKNAVVLIERFQILYDVIEHLKKGNDNIVGILAEKYDDMVEIFSSLANLDKEYVEDLSIEEFVPLVEAVFEMNKDGFFLLLKTLERHNLKKKPKENGQKPSPSSSKKVTNWEP